MSKKFSDLGISAPILKAITELQIEVPTEIQTKKVATLYKEYIGVYLFYIF